MRVLQLVTTPRPFFDQQVAALERRGVDCVTVEVPRPADGGGRSAREYLRFLPSVLARSTGSFDLVHANSGLTGPAALLQPTRPVVLTLWGTDLVADRTATDRLVGRLSRWTARTADAVVLPSRAMAGHLDCEHDLVPFGVDTDLFRPLPRAEARERVGWEPDETAVLFPYDPDRRVKDYPRARRTVEAADVDARLRVVTGVPYEEMPYYLNASDALLVTSRRESGPMVVKEAAACGVPVVSTDVGFVREALAGREDAAVCRTDRGLRRGLERVLDAERPGDRSPAAVTGVDEMVDRLLDVYDRVLADPGSARGPASRTEGTP